jgi:hypothetical protein
MKKRFIIYGLFLSGSFFFNQAIQAQQQKKPSERSFTTEIKKVKQIQAARDQKIGQSQQPIENSVVPVNNNSTTDGGQNQTNNANRPTEKKQSGPATKPSSGLMRQPQKPVTSRG